MRKLILFLLPLIISGYEWATPQLIDSVGPQPHHYSRFGLDRNGILWCIFLKQSVVYGSRYIDTVWSEPDSIYGGPQATGVGGFDVTTARDGKLWVLTCEEALPVSPDHITFYYDDSVWSDTFIIPPLHGGTFFRMAADSIGKVWVVFSGFDDWRLWCDVCMDTFWSGPFVVCSLDDTFQVLGNYITVDPRGKRWVLGNYSSQHLLGCFLTYSDSTGAWSGDLIMGPNALGRSIVSDRLGNIWIAYIRAGYSIYTTYLDTSGNWGPGFPITQPSVSCKMVVDNYNKIWIIYDKNNTIYFQVWNGTEWSPEDTIVSAGSYRDIFYDPIRNRIWVSFSDSISDLYVTWTNPSSGIIEKRMQSNLRNYLKISNPIKEEISIWYSISEKTRVNLSIYDNSGRLKERLFAGEKESGSYNEKYLLRDYPDGIYFLILITSKEICKQKFVVIR